MMRHLLVPRASLGAALAGAVVLALAPVPASGQHYRPSSAYQGSCAPVPCPAPELRLPGSVPSPAPSPGMPPAPGTTDGMTAPSPSSEVAFGEQRSAPGGGGDYPQGVGGYIDSAVVRSQFRLRYDAAYRNNRPDRAEYFYAKCGCFRTDPPPLNDLDAAGPPVFPETNVDYQELLSYLEVALSQRFSLFVEVPVRFINPDANANSAGLGDIRAGFKYAFVACPDRYLTFQFKTYSPTGDPDRGLGTNHVSLEPGMLFYRQLGERTVVEGEVRDWIPIPRTDFAGNVLSYGLGVSYFVLGSPSVLVAPTGAPQLWVAPVAEVVGWTVLSGKELFSSPLGDFAIDDAAGDTIVNLKLGVRLGLGDYNSIYLGYGRALTGEFWYKDMLRLEYRFYF